MVYDWYDARRTVNTTFRTCLNATAVSNEYLLNAEEGLSRYCRDGLFETIPMTVRGAAHGVSVVLHDNFEYGLEMMVKCALMIEGLHGYNDTKVVHDHAGIAYTEVVPGHDWNLLFNEQLSERMRFAIEFSLRGASEPPIPDAIKDSLTESDVGRLRTLHRMRLSDLTSHLFNQIRFHLLQRSVLGENDDGRLEIVQRTDKQSMDRNSLRYDIWNMPIPNLPMMLVTIGKVRHINGVLPSWFGNKSLDLPPFLLDDTTDYEEQLTKRERDTGGRTTFASS